MSEAFLAKARIGASNSTSVVVTIPAPLVKLLEIELGDILRLTVEVAARP